MATPADLRILLEATTVPVSLVDELLADTNALWLANERDDLVAGELVLCHPPLDPGEVRAVVRATDEDGSWRINVVTADRPGLLAATAGVLASDGLSVAQAAVTVLPTSRLALQRITVTGRAPGRSWDEVGRRLRQVLGEGATVPVVWQPSQPVTVTCHPQGSGRAAVQVEAPDTVGLLWAICRELGEQGANIEAARLSGENGTAKDTFIVVGAVDPERLADALSDAVLVTTTSSLGRLVTAPLTLGLRGIEAGVAALDRLRTH